MNKIYKISIAIILITAIISGCVGTKTENGTNTTGGKIAEQKADQKSLMNLEHFIDTKLKNVNIQNSNSNIKIVRFEIEDKRDSEKSENFNLRTLVSNDGSVPVYINGYVKFLNKNPLAPRNYIFLKSGERAWLNVYTGRISNAEYYTLGNLNTLIIVQKETVIPTISSEFRNYRNFTMIRHNTVEEGFSPSPFIDFYSLTYQETAEKWKYAIIGIQRNDKGGQVEITLKGKDGNAMYGESGALMRTEFINPGQIRYVKIPLSKFSADDVYEVNILSYPPQQ